eukprot:4223798-Lingulodinium_polyedra.AAC.1
MSKLPSMSWPKPSPFSYSVLTTDGNELLADGDGHFDVEGGAQPRPSFVAPHESPQVLALHRPARQ